MKVAISVTKIYEVPIMTLDELAKTTQEDPDMDWYDAEALEEIWSYSVVGSSKIQNVLKVTTKGG